MKVLQFTLLLYLTSLVASAPPSSSPNTDLVARDASPLESYNALEKRKGGGGGKGGSSGSSSSGSSSGSGGGGGSVSGGRTSSGGTYSYSPASNVGGRTRDGSGTPKSYGNRYAGGAVVPYTAGARSPTRGIAPFALPLAGFAIFPGLWLYGSLYAYPYYYPYHWNENGQNRTSNVTCLCQRYQVCGCDPDDNSTFLTQTVTNGSSEPIAPVNTSTVRTVTYDNGTTADGGTDPSNDSQASPAVRLAMEMSGYWVMIATVVVGMWMAA